MQMQSLAKAPPGSNRPAKPTILNTASYIVKENGVRGLYRGVAPRILLGVWQTVRSGAEVLLTTDLYGFIRRHRQGLAWRRAQVSRADSRFAVVSLSNSKRSPDLIIALQQQLHGPRITCTGRFGPGDAPC